MPYSRPSSPFDQAGNYLRRSQIPATILLIAVCVVLFLINFFTRNALVLTHYFGFQAPIDRPSQLVGLFTYPLLTPDFLWLVFACAWLFFVGGSLERSWGSSKFLVFFITMTAMSGIGLIIGTAIFHTTMDLRGNLWLPVTSLTVAWATINPYISVCLYGIFSVQARWIAVFEVGVIYFVYYAEDPRVGLFVLLGAASAYLAVKLGVMTGSVYRGGPGPDLRIINGGANRRRPLDDIGSSLSLNPIERYRAWQQRRKLAKLLQKSGFKDRDDNDRNL